MKIDNLISIFHRDCNGIFQLRPTLSYSWFKSVDVQIISPLSYLGRKLPKDATHSISSL